MIGDGQANVRFRVALALGLSGSERGIQALEKLASDEYTVGEHFVVKAFVAMALGKIGHESGVKILARVVEDKDPVVRWHAAVALGDIGHESGLEHLSKLVSDLYLSCALTLPSRSRR